MITSLVLFAEFVNRPPHSRERHSTHRRCWVTRPFRNWKNATKRMKDHERSSLYTRASLALLVITKHGSVVQQLHSLGMQEWEKRDLHEISPMLHSLSYPAMYCSLNHFYPISWFSCVLWGLGIASFRWKYQTECSIHFSRGSGWLYQST